jgi:hypothetical protein
MSEQVQSNDMLRYRAHADAIMTHAAEQLRELLSELTDKIDPFPEFPGSFFSYGIEVEPSNLGDSNEGSLGCVILAEDGTLYELQIGAEADQLDTDDPATARSEIRTPLENLSSAEYAIYAHRAIEAAITYIEDTSS